MEEGNLKAPPRWEVVLWILNAWVNLDRNIVIKSFPVCGLNLPPDGSKDHSIHCFKEEQSCSAGAAIFMYETLKLNAEILDVDNNPFQQEDPTDSDMDDATEDHILIDRNGDDDDTDDHGIEIV